VQRIAKPQVRTSSPLEADAPWKGWSMAGIVYASSQKLECNIGRRADVTTAAIANN
jgi:hypothetical protein